MDEFDKALAQIGINNASEINGDLKDYFSIIPKENGRYNLKWEKTISTHIRHKVAALVKKHYVAPVIK